MRTKLWHLGLWFLRASEQSCSALWDNEALILVWIMRQSLAALLSFLFLLWMLCMCDGALMEASLFPSCLRGIKRKYSVVSSFIQPKNGMFPAGLKSVNNPE